MLGYLLMNALYKFITATGVKKKTTTTQKLEMSVCPDFTFLFTWAASVDTPGCWEILLSLCG